MNTSVPQPGPGTWTVHGAAVIGAEGHLVRVEASRSGGGQEPARLAGLPEISAGTTWTGSAPPW